MWRDLLRTSLLGAAVLVAVPASVTNATGSATVSVGFPFQIPYGWVFTATATDQQRNTSELARCIVVQ